MQKEQLLEEAFEAKGKVRKVTLKRKRKLGLNESVSVLAYSLSEIVPKDSFDIYQNTRKDIIDEKPDSVTLRESHGQEKAQITNLQDPCISNQSKYWQQSRCEMIVPEQDRNSIFFWKNSMQIKKWEIMYSNTI